MTPQPCAQFYGSYRNLQYENNNQFDKCAIKKKAQVPTFSSTFPSPFALDFRALLATQPPQLPTGVTSLGKEWQKMDLVKSTFSTIKITGGKQLGGLTQRWPSAVQVASGSLGPTWLGAPQFTYTNLNRWLFRRSALQTSDGMGIFRELQHSNTFVSRSQQCYCTCKSGGSGYIILTLSQWCV